MEINFKDYISGGYFLIKQADKSEYMAEFLPSKIISASSCIVDMFPEVWSTDEEFNQAKRVANDYGVAIEEMPKVMEWTKENYELETGWANVFFSQSKAKEFRNFFYNSTLELSIIGIGLNNDLVEEYVSEDERFGVYESLKQRKSLESNGQILGFEVLGSEHGSFHSWLCNGLEKDCKKEFDIVPNQNGFIEKLDEAKKCAEYANIEEVGAEPCLWLPWLIVKYNL